MVGGLGVAVSAVAPVSLTSTNYSQLQLTKNGAPNCKEIQNNKTWDHNWDSRTKDSGPLFACLDKGNQNLSFKWFIKNTDDKFVDVEKLTSTDYSLVLQLKGNVKGGLFIPDKKYFDSNKEDEDIVFLRYKTFEASHCKVEGKDEKNWKIKCPEK